MLSGSVLTSLVIKTNINRKAKRFKLFAFYYAHNHVLYMNNSTTEQNRREQQTSTKKQRNSSIHFDRKRSAANETIEKVALGCILQPLLDLIRFRVITFCNTYERTTVEINDNGEKIAQMNEWMRGRLNG